MRRGVATVVEPIDLPPLKLKLKFNITSLYLVFIFIYYKTKDKVLNSIHLNECVYDKRWF